MAMLFAADILQRWAEGFGNGAIVGAVIGIAIALVVKLLISSNSGSGTSAWRARAAARGLPETEQATGIGCGALLRAAAYLIGAGLCGLFGFYFLIVGVQTRKLAEVAQATPQPLTLAHLLEKGPGDNLNVQLERFTFGQPVIEEGPEDYECVWLVLKPTGHVPSPDKLKYQAAVLRAGTVRDRPALDALLKQPTVTALVTSPLNDGLPIAVKPTETFLKSQPKFEQSKTVLLNDKLQIDIPFGPDLKDGAVFDSRWGTALLAGGIVLCILGCVLFFVMIVGRKKRAPA